MTDDLVVLSGPAGVGKGTVVAALRAELPDLVVSVSATTRHPRTGEIDGCHYHFLSDEEFSALVASNGFLEWENFGGRRYGTPWASIEQPLAQGRTVLLEIDVKGALQVKRRHPAARLIFLAPPGPEALRERLRARGTESPEQIAERLAIAGREMAVADEFDDLVVNDDLGAAVAELTRILKR